ncbi:MAG: hypothetical protein ACRD1C_04780 [Terriglobales bacterium]
MQGMGCAIMGTAVGSGPHRAVEAARAAISSPLLENTSIEGAPCFPPDMLVRNRDKLLHWQQEARRLDRISTAHGQTWRLPPLLGRDAVDGPGAPAANVGVDTAPSRCIGPGTRARPSAPRRLGRTGSPKSARTD